MVELEAAFPSFIKSKRASGCERLRTARFEYKRQYYGFSHEGRSLIYVNAFCDPDDLFYWETTFVMVFDGGDCFYQATYDPVAHEFVECYVNGVA